jgi:hypothetical protein
VRDILIYIGICAVLLAALFACTMGVSFVECTAKTENIGFASDWGPFSGCRIEVESGQWIPLESYYFKQE